MTVWVPKESGHDFSSAKKYGEIMVVVPTDQSPFNIDALREHFRKAFLHASPKDYVIPSGPALVNIIMFDEWPFKGMNVLMFHARTKEYVYREVYANTTARK